MAVRYFVEDTSNLLKSATDYDAEPTPAGHIAVLKSTIEAAYDGDILLFGTWDGTDYEPPAGYVAPFDPTVGAGVVKQAAHNMLDVFDAAVEVIERNRTAWPQEHIEWAITGIHWQTVNAARIALNSVRTAAFRQKWCEEAGSWPTMVNGDVSTVRRLV